MFPNQYLLEAEKLRPSMLVAQTITSNTGKILLKQGSILTEQCIKNIIKWQISSVSIALPDKMAYSQQKKSSFYEDTLHLIMLSFAKHKVFKEVPIIEYKELVGSHTDLLLNIVSVAEILYNVRIHNEYTFNHSINVANISGVIGKWLGFKEQNLKDIILTGLLHDIGKVMIPTNILDKPGKLIEEEISIIQTHPMHGYHLLAEYISISEEVKLGILQHHEREDGSGYPFGVQGKDIHPYAGIVAIAEMYDAMSSARVYRPTLSLLSVIEIIIEQMKDKLNPEICSIFLVNIHRSLKK